MPFKPVGACIYCGVADCELTDEHIIPLGLGGQDILPAASCKPCAVITGKFEGAVQRTIFGDFRIRYNLPTRRKKERPKTKKINTTDGAETEAPSVEFPAVYWVYNFGRCGYLLEAPPNLDVSNGTVSTIHNHEEIITFTEKYKWDQTVKMKYIPNEFRRMLAKIGYSYLVAVAGYGSFKPLILDAILKDDFNISYLVGQLPETEPTVQSLYDLRLKTKHHTYSSQSIFVLEIRLFPSNPSPTYEVIVGETNSRDQYLRVMENIRNSGHVETFGSII